ncbi:transcription factor grauzone isoform X2 [Ceratitis capitata]|uniref:transcription factor grauzone isoform X2 n=1 Tax=Ceratitis capitata TaxID=7213 RepID=UPI0006188094|nr:transcription factor grauzone isoform X2 [Ceratitis capitata]
MVCTLCLEDESTVARFVGIFSKEGTNWGVGSIISQHLWLKLEKETCDGQRICWTCWEALRDFHVFYLRIAELHNHVDSKRFKVINEEANKDPFLQDIQLKSEIQNAEHNLEILHSSDNLVASVKIEVQEFESLAAIEIIERNKTKGIQLRSRRGRPRKVKDIKEATTIKYNTNAITSSSIENDIDSETELPLSILMKDSTLIIGMKENRCALEAADEHDDMMAGMNVPNSTSEPLKRRRGRPKKNVENKIVLPSSHPDKKDNATSLEIKVESSAFDSDLECTNNAHEISCEIAGISGTDDSDNSSSDNEGSDDSYEPKQKYAFIPKKKVVKPKKYRKREKPLIPVKHKSREEIEARKAEQEEYERVIKSFFGQFICPICEALVHNFTEIREHFRFAHNVDPGYMMCCGRKFTQRKSLAEHIYLHWNPEHFKCKTCGQVCNNSRNLTEHEESHIDPDKVKEKKTFQCDGCQNVYATKAALQQHTFSKHVPKSEFKHACTECNKKLPTSRSLQDHVKTAHGPRSTVICDKCGKQVRSSYLKKHHQLEHFDEPRPTPEPQQCQICGAWLRHQAGLKQHMKSLHEDVGGEHRCQICNKVSTNARALRRHVYLNHECERKFKCTMCEKAFKRPQDLREHTSVHTGKVLYTCPNCPMTFFSSANMYKHRQRLHRAQYEADRKKPRHTFNIMAESKGRTEGKLPNTSSNSTNSV